MHRNTLLLDYLNPYLEFDSDNDLETEKSMSGFPYPKTTNEEWAIDVAILMSLRDEEALEKLSDKVALIQSQQELLALEAAYELKKAELERLIREGN